MTGESKFSLNQKMDSRLRGNDDRDSGFPPEFILVPAFAGIDCGGDGNDDEKEAGAPGVSFLKYGPCLLREAGGGHVRA